MPQPSFAAGNTEKRRFVRRLTRQTARIRFGESAPIPSEIRDYCQTGLYVVFLGEGTPDAAIPIMAGHMVGVEFGGSGSGIYRFAGRVARVSPNGIGVFVSAMPDGALDALRGAGSRIGQAGPAPAQPGLGAHKRQAALLECSNRYRGFLDTVMQEFFQRAEEKLADAGLEELSFLERSRYEYGAQELAQRRSHIEEAFFGAIRERLQQAGQAQAKAGGPAETGKLALVDEGEFEDWLNLSAVIKQIESACLPQLDEFEQRYSLLLGQEVDRKGNPYGPETLARAFQEAIQVLDFSNVMRTVLYKVLGQAVAERSPELYQQLNQALSFLELPAPARNLKKQAETTEKASSDAPRHDLADIADSLNSLYKQEQADDGRSPENADYSLDHILSSLNQVSRKTAAGRPAHRSDDLSALNTRHQVLPVVSRLQQTAEQLGGQAASSRIPAAPAADAAAQPLVSMTELLAILDRLPLAGQESGGAAAAPLPLAEQIVERIAAAGGGSLRLDPGHRQILDNTSNLFFKARSDFVPSSDLEALAKRLERPLLKLALQDASFPNSPDHPARQVFNLIEQFSVAADDKGRLFDAKLQRFLYLLVDRVCSRADEDPGIFEVARDSLEKVLRPILQNRRARVARLQESSEGKSRIKTARKRVNAALENRLAGRDVPGILLRLLDAGWRQYLVIQEMRGGEQGAAFAAGLEVLDRLMARLGPDRTAAANEPDDAQGLLNDIEHALKTVSVDAGLLSLFMDELGDALANQTDASAPGHAIVHVPPGRLASRRSESDATLSAHPRLADRLRIGDWWDISLDGRPVPMQLIWTSQPPLMNVFANRSATAKQEFTLAELSRRMQGGQARPGKDFDLPLIERSENALFDETYQHLMDQVLIDPLTGLLNRKGFMHRLNQLSVPELEDRVHAVGIIEFDQFRMIYNTCGVEAVERLARTLADEVRALVGHDAALASFRDDTLAILLPNCSRADGCLALDHLLNEIKDYHFQHEQHSYSIGFNIGITEYPPDKFTPSDAIRHADSACITAKSLGRNRIQVYDQASPQLQSQESLMDWAGRIDSFLNGNGMHLRCQQVRPISAESSLLPYYEILLGIETEDGIAINPMTFVPAVERLQRSHEVDIWVLRKVFGWIMDNPDSFETVGGFAINLSATSLSSPEVMAYLQEVLPGNRFPTRKITFEITETAAIGSYGAAQDFIREIRRYGCKFALDDFGSGFTSYSHLKNLRTDSLKIDGSFVKDMLKNPGDYAMVKSMNDIAHSLGLRTVAEYVESPQILEALREIGVDYAQGYAVHKPCRIEDIAWVETV